MLSLALVVALGGLTRASYDSIFGWLTVALNPDLFVSPSQSLTQRDFRFPESMGAQLRAIPGVGEVQLVRDARIEIQGKPTMFVAADIADLRQHATLPPVAGNTEEMFRLAAQGKAVLASENFALLRGFKLGDVVDIPSPSGMLHLPIAGIVTDYSDEQGSLLVDRALYKRYWNDTYGECFPHLSGARRGGSRREAADSGKVRQSAAAVRADQSRSAPLHSAIDGSVVRHHVRADRGRGAGGGPGHREYSDCIHHRSPARAGRVAGGGRAAQSDPREPSGWRRWRWERWA